MGLFDDLLGENGSKKSDTTPAIATTFGYNDPEDNGIGAWGDVTNRPDVHGVSLPISVLRQQFGNENKAHGQLVKITNPDNGQSIVAPIIDKGPSESLRDRIDLTHATNQAIGGSGKTPVNYEFVNTPQKGGLFDDLLEETKQPTQPSPQVESKSSGLFDDLLGGSEKTSPTIALPQATPQQLAAAGTQGYPSSTSGQQSPKPSQLTSGLSAGIEGTVGLLSGLGAVAGGEALGIPVTGGASLLAVPALFTAGSALGVVGAKRAEKLLGLEPEIQASQQEYPKTAFAGQMIPQLPFAAESALGYGATALTKGAGAVAGQMAGQAAIGAGIMEPMRYGVDVSLNKMGITDQPAAPITLGSTGEQVLTALALGGKATGLAPSRDPIVNDKTAQIFAGAESQTATPPEQPKPINIPPATPEELAKVGEVPIANTGETIPTNEAAAIAEEKPAEAPVAEAQPEKPDAKQAPQPVSGVGETSAVKPTAEVESTKSEVAPTISESFTLDPDRVGENVSDQVIDLFRERQNSVTGKYPDKIIVNTKDLRDSLTRHLEDVFDLDLRPDENVTLEWKDAHPDDISDHPLITVTISNEEPAEVPVAEAQPTEKNAIQKQTTREVGIRNAPAVGEGVGRQNEAEVPTQEGQVPKEEITGAEELGRKPVGISKAAVNEQRLNRMVESLPESEREPNAQKINDALDINSKSRIPVESLVSDILEKGNTARTPEEVALMTVEMNRLQLEREQLQKQFEQIKDPRPSDYAILNSEIKPIDEKINRLEKAVDKVGTSAGRLLQMFKIMLAEDYSPVALERKAVRDLRRPLTEDEKQTIAKQAEEHKALLEARDKTMASEQLKVENEAVKARYEEALKEIEALKAKAKKTPKEPSPNKTKTETPIDQKIVDKLNAMAEKVRQERKGKLYAKISPVDIGDVIIGASHIANGLKSFKDWSVKMASEVSGATKEYLKKVWDAAHEKLDSLQGGRTPEDVRARIKAEAVAGEELSHKSVDDLVKAHLEDGLRGEDEVMKAVHDDIKEAYPNATERDVRRAFSEYGKQVKVNPDELLKRKRELKTLVRLQESINRLKEGLPALKTNSRREKVIQEIREKQAVLNELLKSVKAPPTDEQLSTANSKKITALKNAIEDLDKQLRTGERPPPKTRAEEPIDVEQLRSELDAMRKKREEIDREEAPKFSAQEKENERLRKLYDKQIAELDARLKGVEKAKAEKTPFDQNKENEQKMAERDAMRQKLKEIEKQEADRKKPSPEQKEIDRIQKAIDDTNDRIDKGEKTAPTPKKEPLTEYAKRLLEDLKKAREQFKKVTGKEPESREDRYNRRRIETIEKRIADMEDRMKRGDTSKPTRKEPPIKYPATDLAEARLKAKEREINDWREKKEKDERPNWERKLRATSETARELTIAGINVLKKIGGYMPARALATSVEEVVGYTGKHLMGFGGVRGELESGASPLKTFPAQARGYLKGAKQFLRTLKAGESDSSLMYDKSHIEQRSSNWARWIGSNLHAALKNISATGKEEVYKEHLYANAIADGLIDPSNPFDPKNQMAIAALNLKAYVASKVEKLSEDNKAAELIAQGHKWLESPNKQGELNPTAVIASHSIKAAVTKGIYKIGINYPAQTLKYAISKPLEAVGRTLNAYWKGLDNIKPKEMDLISSAYKMGGVGAAMMLWGVVDAFNDEKDRVFGGYYQQGRKAGDAKWGTMRLFGTNWHIHMPAVEAAQFANTITRAFIKNHKKFDVGMSGIQAFAEAMTGLISSAPIAGPITEISKSPSNWVSYMIQGAVPSAVRDVAKMTDVTEKGETQHRYPRTIIENLKVATPGLRKQVRQYQWQK